MSLFKLKSLRKTGLRVFSSNWRLRTQVAVTLLFLQAFSTLFVIGSLHINQAIIRNVYQSASHTIFRRMTKAQLNSAYLLMAQTEDLISVTMKEMDVVNRLQLYIQKQAEFQVQQPYECITDCSQLDSYAKDLVLCIGFFNKSDHNAISNSVQLTMNTTAILQSFSILGNFMETQMGVAHKDPIEFFTMFRWVPLPKSYHPTQRGWYLYHLMSPELPISKYILGHPFQPFMGDTKIVITTNLTSLNQSFEGVIAKEVQFPKQITQINSDNTKHYLFNDQGLVLYGSQYSEFNQSLFYLYNTSITGFNEENWSEIINYTKGLPFNNHCDDVGREQSISAVIVPENILCLYNEIEREHVFISVKNISDYPIKLLVYKRVKLFQENQTQLFSFIMDSFDEQSMQFLMIDVLVTALLILVAILASTLVMNQTNLFIYYSIEYLRRFGLRNVQKMILVMQKQMLVTSSTLNEFYRSMEGLLHGVHKNNKSTYCKSIEQIQFINKNHQREYDNFQNNYFSMCLETFRVQFFR